MNDPRRMGRALEGIGKVKSKSRAANGFLRSPEKARKTFAEDLEDIPGRDLEDDLSEADSDDLDAPVARPRKQSAVAAYNDSTKPTAPKPDPRRETSVFKQLAAAASDDLSRDRGRPDRRSTKGLDQTASDHRNRHTDVKRTSVETSKNPFTTSIDDFETLKPIVKEEPSAYLIKRRQKKEEEEKRKAKEKKASVEVPTFII
jgi:hypothetical protein